MSRILLTRVDDFVPNSNPVRDSMRHVIPTRSRMDIVTSAVPRGVEAEAETIARPDFLPAEDGYICFVGNMGKHKGLGDLLMAYESLGSDAPPLVILGVPNLSQPTTWPTGVVVRENVPHAVVMATWKHCAFGVVPSRWAEPFATVAIECGAMGKAGIVTNVGGLPQIVRNQISGIVVPPRDPIALAAAMSFLLSHPERAEQMGRAAMEHTKEMRLDVMSDMLVEKLQSRLTDSSRQQATTVASSLTD